MRYLRVLVILFVSILLASQSGCGDDDVVEMVTIEGVVRNASNQEPLSGVRVSIPDGSSITTGGDGRFTFRVPLSADELTIQAQRTNFEESTVFVIPNTDRSTDILMQPIIPLTIEPFALDFGTASLSESFNINNTRDQPTSYTITTSSSFLTTEPDRGQLGSRNTALIRVNLDRSQAPIGASTEEIVVNIPDLGSRPISVSFTRLDPSSAVLSVDQGSLGFGTDLIDRTLTLRNSGERVLNWDVNVTESWIGLSRINGSISPGDSLDIKVTVDRTSLSDGVYEGQVIFTSNGGMAPVNINMEVDNGSSGGQGGAEDDDNDGFANLIDADDDGDGLIDIYTINELNDVRDDLRGLGVGLQGAPEGGFVGYELMNDLDFLNDNDYSDVGLRSNVTTGLGWLPIGNSSNPFATVFEGNGFIIRNLTIDRTTSRNGLFGQINNLASIRNLNVEIRFFSGAHNSGGLVGVNNGGEISGCSVIGSISGTSNIGVLVGENRGTISSCFTEGSINGTTNVGGLVGLTIDAQNDRITLSYSNVDVVGNSNIGGLIGDLTRFGEVSFCYAMGPVSSNSSLVGGLIGDVGDGTINSCYATGPVSSSSADVGGLIGGNSGTVITSYSIGSVQGTSRVGGLIGSNSGSVPNTSYWDTEASGTSVSAAGSGLSTIDLQGTTSNIGIYSTWNPAVWDFGSTAQYPALLNLPNGLEAQR